MQEVGRRRTHKRDKRWTTVTMLALALFFFVGEFEERFGSLSTIIISLAELYKFAQMCRDPFSSQSFLMHPFRGNALCIWVLWVCTEADSAALG